MADIAETANIFLQDFVEVLKIALPIGLVIFVLCFLLYRMREKKIYKFPVTIISEREAGGTDEYETKGGFIAKKGGAPVFRMKWGGLFKTKEIYEPPKLYGITGTNRIFYYQKDVDTFVQLKRVLGEDLVTFEPVESDVKHSALLGILRIKQFAQSQGKLEKFITPIMFITGMILLLVMFLVMVDKFDPGLMKQVADQLAVAAEALARAKGG